MVEVRIRGIKSELVEVTISDREIHRESLALVRRNLMPADIPAGAYINRDGCWEQWEDGRGSGSTTTHRRATEDEAHVFNTIAAYEKLTH